MSNLLFWFHIIVVVTFLSFYIHSFNKNFVKPKLMNASVKFKMVMILLVWSFLGVLGILFKFIPQTEVEEVCGMFWLAELSLFLFLIILEASFIGFGFLLKAITKNLSDTDNPISIFNNQL